MNIDLKEVNIANEEDIKEVEDEWNYYFDNQYSFSPYKEKLLKINIIVGFGRGFWAGVHGYSYLIYHKELDKFYWYLRDIESDKDVFFYEIEQKHQIFSMLKNMPIEQNFDVYDHVIDYGVLYALSCGNISEIPKEYKAVDLKELFGEDTEQLRIALMEYRPATRDTYPHQEFHRKVFVPAFQNKLNNKARQYNQSYFNVFRNGEELCINLDGDIFKLIKE